MKTTHGLRRLHRYVAAVRVAFAVVDHVVVADDVELAAAAAAGGVSFGVALFFLNAQNSRGDDIGH